MKTLLESNDSDFNVWFMKKRILGKTGLSVPEMGMGCWAIGGKGYGPTDDSESMAALEEAWDGGVRLFDTADTYGEGHSEKLLGQFLKTKARDTAVIATKAGVDFYPSSLWKKKSGKASVAGHKKNFDSDYLRFACEQSLKRLSVETIDLYQLHNPSLALIQNGEVVSVLEDLKKQGKIRHIGISVHREEEAIAAMKDARVEVLQVIFNLLDQRMAKTVFKIAHEKNIGILAREPLASGLLTGKYSAEHAFQKDDHRNRWRIEKKQADSEKIKKIRELIPTEIALSQAALEFALSESAVSSVIPGAKTPEQIRQNLKAICEPKLKPEEVTALQKLFSTNGLFKNYLLPA